MISRCSFQMSLRAAALVGVFVFTTFPSPAQQPGSGGRNPHDGEWSLEYRVCTRPGGEILTFPDDNHIYNFLFQVAKESFTVAADGALKWEQREGGLMHVDDYSAALGRTWFQDQQPVLRASVQATATPAAAEAGRTYDRKLSLQLAWTGGNGPGVFHDGKPFVISISADGSQWTGFGGTRAAPYQKSQWDLRPASVKREEVGVDTICETTIFRASRPMRLTDPASPTFSCPGTEQIEIKHVHYPRLVPRG